MVCNLKNGDCIKRRNESERYELQEKLHKAGVKTSCKDFFLKKNKDCGLR